MHGHTMTDFVAMVSRGDDRAYAIASVDPCLMSMDETQERCEDTYDALAPVLGNAADAIARSGSAVLVLEDLAEAGAIALRIRDRMGSMPDVGLVVSFLVRGHVMLDVRQEGASDPELPLAPQPELM